MGGTEADGEGTERSMDAQPPPELDISAISEENISKQISVVYWLKGAVISLFVTAVPVLIGALSSHSDVRREPVEMWYKCWGPIIALLVIEVGCANLLAPKICYDMIEERSDNIPLKESMRSNITSQGLIAALFLTIVFAMIRESLAITAVVQSTLCTLCTRS